MQLRADLMTESHPEDFLIPEDLESWRSDEVVGPVLLRLEAERALANGATRCGAKQVIIPPEGAPIDAIVAARLFALAHSEPLDRTTASRIVIGAPHSSWHYLLLAFCAEARGRSALQQLSDAMRAAEQEQSLAAKWAILQMKARHCGQRMAFREERNALLQMAELLEHWLLRLDRHYADAASKRPDRARFRAHLLSPVTGSAHLVTLALEMASERDLEKLEALALDAAIAETGAERGVLILRDGADSHRIALARQLDADAAQRMRLSSTVARRALEAGEVVVSNDIAADAALNSIESIEFGIRSVLCVPIRARAAIEGAIYLDRSRNGRPFDEAAIAAAQAIGAMLASHLLNGRTLDELTTRTEQLENARAELASALKLHADESERVNRKLGTSNALEVGQQLVGKSRTMQGLREAIRRVAASTAPVFVHGETGSGKELVAHAVHDASSRRTGPFVAINCASMSETLIESELFGAERGAYTNATASRAGLFEAADTGTLFLDEVGDMSSSLQKSQLRVLETGEVRRIGSTKTRKIDVRVVSASHKDLAVLVEQERFRADLRFRLDVVRIEVPPLREHVEDMRDLAEVLLAAAREKYKLPTRRISDGAILALQRRAWPGNVRELRHVLANAALMALGHEITERDILAPSPSMAPPGTREFHSNAREFTMLSREEQLKELNRALAEARGHRGQAAKLLGISRASFYRYWSQVGGAKT
jgi:DNA-binding NtrC family response regulator